MICTNSCCGKRISCQSLLLKFAQLLLMRLSHRPASWVQNILAEHEDSILSPRNKLYNKTFNLEFQILSEKKNCNTPNFFVNGRSAYTFSAQFGLCEPLLFFRFYMQNRQQLLNLPWIWMLLCSCMTSPIIRITRYRIGPDRCGAGGGRVPYWLGQAIVYCDSLG